MIFSPALEGIVGDLMEQRPAERYRYPLGYSTWTSEEIMAAVECLCEQRTTMWTKCEDFERQFAAYLGADDAVMVNSGSSADLIIMLVAVELGLLKRGDEILIPAVTWPTQVWAAIQAGLHVKLVDVDIDTLNTSPEILEEAVTSQTKAVSLVHLMGNPCDMERIRDLVDRKGLLLFEDCCEALGAAFDGQKVGTFGIASAFSFFASHHISTMEGGMIVTSDPVFAEGCRLMRAHGWARDLRYRVNDVEVLTRYGCVEDARYLFLSMGFNFRPTELQGAIGQIQLKKLDAMNEVRDQHAKKIGLRFRLTNGHVEPLSPTTHKSQPAWFAAPFVLREGLPYTRKDVTAHLEQHSIDTRPIVGGNLARHPAFWKYGMNGHLPGANAIHDRGFYCGLPPVDANIDGMIGALNSADPILRSRLCA